MKSRVWINRQDHQPRAVLTKYDRDIKGEDDNSIGYKLRSERGRGEPVELESMLVRHYVAKMHKTGAIDMACG